jgi:23S rRNA (cytosine1962-C5)-methyltransferase
VDTPDRPPADPSSFERPWVQLKYFTYHPHIFPRFIRDASADAEPGAWVNVYDKNGDRFGAGLWNARSRIPLRMVVHSREPAGEEQLDRLVEAAAELRVRILRLDTETDAYRLVNSDGDGVSGLTIDRYGDLLVCDVVSLGIHKRLPRWLPRLHEICGTKRHLVRVSPDTSRNEGIQLPRPGLDPEQPVPGKMKICENGVTFEVDFSAGHKTGFFCDQRPNRKLLTKFTRGARVLDLCCYTGGFSISALKAGGAEEITGVDYDEDAIALARRNANLNQLPQNRQRWIHADAFGWSRQMMKNNQKWDVVILDPPKLVMSRDFEHEDGPERGRKKYEDLNRLAMQLTRKGGLLVTCSCSGLVSPEQFERYVTAAAHNLGVRLQILDRTGPGPDHPEYSNCPESRYLKVIWARVV